MSPVEQSCGCGCHCSAEEEVSSALEVGAVPAACKIETLSLTGLDCADCARKLEQAVARLEGVMAATVNFAAGKLKVSYDEALVSRQVITDTIKGLGYGVRESGQEQQKMVFELKGLDCADCARKLETRLNRLPGVHRAEVNFQAGKLYVEGTAAVEQLVRAVAEAGYEAVLPRQAVAGENSFWRENKRSLLTILAGALWLLGMACWYGGGTAVAVPVLVGAMIAGGWYTVRAAFYSLRSGLAMDMNVLMTVAVLGAVALGEWVEAATVVFLFSLGNTLEAYTMDKTRRSIRRLMELSPQEALVWQGGGEQVVPVNRLKLGDVVVIKPGSRIPVDGRVVEGSSSVNQAPITGEAVPVAKGVGDEVFAGTINENGRLLVEVTRLAGDTTLARIIALVEEAQAQKAPAERFVDAFARYYTPAVILLAALLAVVPPALFGRPFQEWFYRSLTLLVVACPCALVISTPVSIVAAIGNAARHGVLIKGGAYLEQAGRVKAVAFDKTGTLTTGEPVVTDILPAPGYTAGEVLRLAGSVEIGSEHPLAGAVLKAAAARQLELLPGTGYAAVAGRGARALLQGRWHYVGSAAFFEQDLGLSLQDWEGKIAELETEGKTVILVGTEAEVAGLIACGDRPRETSRGTVAALKGLGRKTVMLTGDNPRTAQALAAELELDDFRAGLLPEDKVQVIEELKKQYGTVAMVGDGINDAPALARADVGIAMGGAGTDTAMETADIVLMADDLSQLPFTVKLSHRALNVIRQNIAFSLLVKAAAVLLVFPGWLNLWIAILADTGAALVVIANGMRLLRVE